jgi:hypothetical protein
MFSNGNVDGTRLEGSAFIRSANVSSYLKTNGFTVLTLIANAKSNSVQTVVRINGYPIHDPSNTGTQTFQQQCTQYLTSTSSSSICSATKPTNGVVCNS